MKFIFIIFQMPLDKILLENFEPHCDNLLELELHVTVIYSQMSFHVTRNGNNKAHQRPEGHLLGLDEDTTKIPSECILTGTNQDKIGWV